VDLLHSLVLHHNQVQQHKSNNGVTMKETELKTPALVEYHYNLRQLLRHTQTHSHTHNPNPCPNTSPIPTPNPTPNQTNKERSGTEHASSVMDIVTPAEIFVINARRQMVMTRPYTREKGTVDHKIKMLHHLHGYSIPTNAMNVR
jgi:hypothetical protein